MPTYNQDDAIDSLAEAYGSHLEQLTKAAKILLLQSLAQNLLDSWLDDEKQTAQEAFALIANCSESRQLDLIIATAALLKPDFAPNKKQP